MTEEESTLKNINKRVLLYEEEKTEDDKRYIDNSQTVIFADVGVVLATAKQIILLWVCNYHLHRLSLPSSQSSRGER